MNTPPVPSVMTPEQAVARMREIARMREDMLGRLTSRNRSRNFHPNTYDGRASQARYDRAFDALAEEEAALVPFLPVYRCPSCGETGCDLLPEVCATR